MCLLGKAYMDLENINKVRAGIGTIEILKSKTETRTVFKVRDGTRRNSKIYVFNPGPSRLGTVRVRDFSFSCPALPATHMHPIHWKPHPSHNCYKHVLYQRVTLGPQDNFQRIILGFTPWGELPYSPSSQPANHTLTYLLILKKTLFY